MQHQAPAQSRGMPPARPSRLAQYVPSLLWLKQYRRQDFMGDLLAGTIVAVMLVPQSMAYALLAGLPPQVGLYASIVPLILYGLLGTSRSLAVGPVALVSLMVMTGLSAHATPGTPDYMALALVLAVLVGIIQVVMGLLRLGMLVNFLSHPVLAGFTSAAALVIIASQLKHLLGMNIPRVQTFDGLLDGVTMHLRTTNVITLGMGLASLLLLLYFRGWMSRHLASWHIPPAWRDPMTKSGPLVVVMLATLLTWGLNLHESAQVSIVGAIPAGLPPLTAPSLAWPQWQALAPTALAISMVGFMESISVAKSLASKRRQKIEANQELLALGMANVGAALTGGYPVTGGLSRSVVNFSAGANTGLASVITAVLIALTVMAFTPLLYFLPNAVLAAIIVVACLSLIDVTTLKHAWQRNKADAASLFITFVGVLVLGIERGIVVGTASAVAFYLWRTSQPHVAIVGRVGSSEHFRNVRRHAVTTYPHILAMRVDESLYFANTRYLEDVLLKAVADQPDVQHVVLICSAVNYIDTSAMETLERLIDDLREAGVSFYLAEVKGPVMDQLQRASFVEHLGANRIFLSTHQAIQALMATGRKHENRQTAQPFESLLEDD